MSALNFLNKNFTNLSLDVVSRDTTSTNAKPVKIGTNDIKNETKNLSFSHGSMIILKKGYYKGYRGYVLEHYPERIDIRLEYIDYVFMKPFGTLKIGSVIMTTYGKSIIMNKIEKLYVIKTDEEELRMSSTYLIKLVYIKNQLMIIKENSKKNYKINLKLNQSTLDQMLIELSKVVKNKKLSEVISEEIETEITYFEDEYYMIIANSENQNDKQYIGKYGKCIGIIDPQYMIKYDRIVRVDRKLVEINDQSVLIKKGQYKNKVGKLVKIYKASLNVYIDALNKSFVKHLVFENGLFKEKNIEVDDVFYCDIVLKDDTTINVKKVNNEVICGVNRNHKTISFKRDEIKVFLPGFKIKNDINENDVTNDDINNEQEFLQDEDVEKNDDEKNDDEDDKERTDYEENENNDNHNEEKEDQFQDEVEMKQSFKDIERCGFMDRSFSKVEKEILSNIDKVIKFLSYPDHFVNKYTLLDKIKESLKVMREDLERININRWKTSDMKYVISNLVIYDCIKNSENDITYNYFTTQVEKLYKVGYLSKTDISGATFLRTEIEKDIINTCFGLVIISSDESKRLKSLYKESKYLEIIVKIMENCGLILQEWFGKIILNNNMSNQIEILSVKNERSMKDYPKYFITTNDILTGNIPETSRNILWGPHSNRLVNVWKNGLNKKMDGCMNEEKKSIYKYVIDNFDKAPFMRDYTPKDDFEKIKYKELMKTFVKFIEQLREYVNLKNSEKLVELQERNKEKERVNKKRREISDLNNLNVDLDDLMLDDKNINKKKIRRY